MCCLLQAIPDCRRYKPARASTSQQGLLFLPAVRGYQSCFLICSPAAFGPPAKKFSFLECPPEAEHTIRPTCRHGCTILIRFGRTYCRTWRTAVLRSPLI